MYHMFLNPVFWLLAVLLATSITLLFIGVIKKDKIALIASGIVFLIFVAIILWLTPVLMSKSVSVKQTIETTTAGPNASTQRSLAVYFATRDQFLNSEMPKDGKGINQAPEVLGFKELATIVVTCPDSMGTPCSGDFLILSKDPIHSGSQEFYLAFTMGTGYVYYGPYTNDLQRIVNESKTIKSLVRSY